jgi:hypothetical protein
MVSDTGSSLLGHLPAWQFVRDWAAGTIEYPELDQRMRTFGERFVHAEWKPTFDAIFDAFSPDEDEDAISLSTTAIALPKALQAFEKAMASHGISSSATPNSTSSSVHPRPCSSRTRPSNHKAQRPTKRRKTGSVFIDDMAGEEDDDTEDEEEEAEGVRVPLVKPAGQVAYERNLHRIVERYEGGQHHESEKSDDVDRSSLPINVDMFQSRENDKAIYVLDLITRK